MSFVAALAAIDHLALRERVASERVCAVADATAQDVRATRKAVTSGVRAYTRDSRPTARVLVVDDTDSVREGLVLALKAAGIDAVGAAKMDEARQVLRERPAVLVLDVHLGRDGLGLPLLAECDRFTRVVIVSALTDGEALRALAELAHADFYLRPIDVPTTARLVALVQQRLREATS